MAPLVGRSRPAMRFRSVDFPQPEGPTMATNSPGATSSEMRSSARTSSRPVGAKCLLTSRTRMAGGEVRGSLLPQLLEIRGHDLAVRLRSVDDLAEDEVRVLRLEALLRDGGRVRRLRARDDCLQHGRLEGREVLVRHR